MKQGKERIGLEKAQDRFSFSCNIMLLCQKESGN